MARIIGIGGIFFQSDEHKQDAAWYQKHLGLTLDQYGLHTFRWRRDDDPETRQRTEWTHMDAAAGYFGDSTSNVMINYIVDDLDGMLADLKEEGVEILGREDEEFGSFAWINDRAGNRIELWQPPENDPYSE